MADLELTLSWLGMTKYLDRFVEAGFDSWATVLEITEDDLEVIISAPIACVPPANAKV